MRRVTYLSILAISALLAHRSLCAEAVPPNLWKGANVRQKVWKLLAENGYTGCRYEGGSPAEQSLVKYPRLYYVCSKDIVTSFSFMQRNDGKWFCDSFGIEYGPVTERGLPRAVAIKLIPQLADFVQDSYGLSCKFDRKDSRDLVYECTSRANDEKGHRWAMYYTDPEKYPRTYPNREGLVEKIRFHLIPDPVLNMK
ncbi:MAG: hypothetical protein HY537_01790 [Deltaproteobacteria bacterium]|nr:hypothetical protein [Deltaproteobacteria bacterium]